MDTFILFIVSVIAWFALEFYRGFTGRQTISGQIWSLYQRFPALGWLSGLVVGTLGAHFFFGQCGP